MNSVDISKLSAICDTMRESPVRNYILAGLDSYMLTNGNVRLFTCSRETQDQITPHSHRFDFVCIVLRGWVVNRVWEPADENDGDFFEESILTYKDEIGSHDVKLEGRNWYSYNDTKYKAGAVYAMNSNQIHSIQFSRNAKVLFFEGPNKSDESRIIEPVVNGKKSLHMRNEITCFLRINTVSLIILNTFEYTEFDHHEWSYKLTSNLSIALDGEEFRGMEIKHPYFELVPEGVLTVKAGYAWDGLSSFPDCDEWLLGSVVHDTLIQMCDEGLLPDEFRQPAHREMRLVLEETSNEFWAYLIYWVDVVSSNISSPKIAQELYYETWKN